MTKRGKKRLSYGAKLPRRAGFKNAVFFDKNELKKPATMKKYRTGYRWCWKRAAVRRYMRSIGFKPPGSYGRNQHGGEMPALPREFSLTDLQAGRIMRKSWQAGGTLSQLEAVRKMLSYFHQMMTSESESNFDSVYFQWDNQDPLKYAPPTQKVIAEVSVETSGLKKAFTTPYHSNCGLSYHEWNVGLLMSHDKCIWGARSQEDLHRIKMSSDHTYAPSQGYCCTALKGGRAKLQRKKGIRPWRCYRVCFCKKGKHDAIPDDWHLDLNSRTRQPNNITWTTECPLNAFKAIQDMTPYGDPRIYPKWNPKKLEFGKESVGKKKLTKTVQHWLNIQGANPDGLVFDSNSGRKSLGKWLSELQILYSWSFEIHGDLWKTWKKHYQANLASEILFERRTQSNDPDECTRALWEFARRLLGRGKTVKADPVDLTLSQDLTVLDLRSRGYGSEVNAILEKHRRRAEVKMKEEPQK